MGVGERGGVICAAFDSSGRGGNEVAVGAERGAGRVALQDVETRLAMTVRRRPRSASPVDLCGVTPYRVGEAHGVVHLRIERRRCRERPCGCGRTIEQHGEERTRSGRNVCPMQPGLVLIGMARDHHQQEGEEYRLHDVGTTT